MSAPRRPRLALVTPLPPVRSGIADYARDLLPFVARDFDVTVFVEDRHPRLAAGRQGEVAVRPASELRASAAGFDHLVYQMGNNVHHRFVLELARGLPGIVVLHDVVLHHLYEEIAGREDEWERYGEALVESYGEDGRTVLRMKRWRLATQRENFAFPLFESLAARSRGVLVHSETARREVARRLPGTPVHAIPMGIPDSPALERRAARRALGLGDGVPLVGAFGFLIPTKRLDVVAAALRRAWREEPAIRLVLIGEESPGFRVEETFDAAELASGRVVHHGYVPDAEYRAWMAATDVAVNLRYPTAGETSASLLRLLGGGTCTLVSAYRQFLEIPAAAVVRIPLGSEEETTLAGELVALARDVDRRGRIAAAARAFVLAHHSMEAAARSLREAVLGIGAGNPSAAPTPPLWRCPRTSRSAAIRGSAEPAADVPGRITAGAAIDVPLRVRNVGASRWIAVPEPTGGHVGVAADVIGEDGALAVRLPPVPLPRDVEVGDASVVCLRLDAPRAAGRYRLQPTLVHFGRGPRRAVGEAIALEVEPAG